MCRARASHNRLRGCDLTTKEDCVRIALRFVAWLGCVALLSAGLLSAADQWIEVKSAHFTVISDAGQGAARTTAWQLEQIRNVLGTFWPWAHVDLDKPVVAFAVRDEASM